MEKSYYRHSVQKCTKNPFDSRAHLQTVCRVWFPTSDRLETWLIPSGTTRSKQLYKSGSVLTEFLPRFLSQILVCDVTFVTFSGDKKCDALHLLHFWDEFDALAHENTIFNLWRFWSHLSPKTSHFGLAGTKLLWTGRNVKIRLGLKHVSLFPSQICHSSLKREAGRPFGLRPTLNHSLRPRAHVTPLLVLCLVFFKKSSTLSCLFEQPWQSGSKHFKRWYRGKLRQTMVDS